MATVVEQAPLPELESLVLRTPGLESALGALLARREEAGRLPRSITLAAGPEAREALRRVFSARAVAETGEGRIRLNLSLFLKASGCREAELEAALYRALGRAPRDRVAVERALLAELAKELSQVQRQAKRAASSAWALAELRALGSGESELAQKASADGVSAAARLAADVVRSIDALGEVRAPVRVQNFAARVLGSSKALRPGTELYQVVTRAILDHDPATRRALEEQGVPPHRSTELAHALEVNGVYLDEAAASVLCFGPLVYEKRGQRFDHVARHAELGESCRLIVHQLRDAVFERPRARRVTLFENLTPYLDCVDAFVERGARDEIVLCSGGQASWAVVMVLSELARFGLEVRHSGDLDRTGVLILRSLRRRTGARIAPLMMDAATHARFAPLGRPLEEAERARLGRMLQSDPPDGLCHDLLEAIARTGVWIEQEQFAEELLARCVGGAADGAGGQDEQPR